MVHIGPEKVIQVRMPKPLINAIKAKKYTLPPPCYLKTVYKNAVDELIQHIEQTPILAIPKSPDKKQINVILPYSKYLEVERVITKLQTAAAPFFYTAFCLYVGYSHRTNPMEVNE